MKFKLTIVTMPGNDLIGLTAQIIAPNWDAAAIAGTKLVEQLGFKMEDVSTLIAYAGKDEIERLECEQAALADRKGVVRQMRAGKSVVAMSQAEFDAYVAG